MRHDSATSKACPQSAVLPRRDMLTALIAAPIVATSNGAVAGTSLATGDGFEIASPDAALLALAGPFAAAWEREKLVAATEPPDDVINAACAVTGGFVQRILMARAKTLDGLRLKARAFLWCGYQLEEFDDLTLLGETTDLHLAISIIRDLLALR